MSFDWQTAVVFTLVTAAGGYVARSAWRSVIARKSAACGGCGTCPAGEQPKQINVIAVEQLAKTADTAALRPLNGEPVGRHATTE